MEKNCMYLVCGFNGRWLKDLNFCVCVCCVSILVANIENKRIGGCISKFTPLTW